nr:hypothetical protein [Tanacetum cinerariifolium]
MINKMNIKFKGGLLGLKSVVEITTACKDISAARHKLMLLDTAAGYDSNDTSNDDQVENRDQVEAFGVQVPPQALAAHAAWVKGQKEVAVLMLLTIDLEIQQNLAHLGAYDMLQELKAMYSKQAEQELLFVQNYNMHGMGKAVNELHDMLKLHEETLPKKDANPALHAIRAGRVRKNQNNKQHKAAMGVMVKVMARWAMLQRMPHLLLNLRLLHHLRKITMQRTPFATNVGASTLGIFTIELYSFPSKSWIYDTGCGTHICITTHGLRGSKKLKPSALSLYVGDGQRAAIEAIKTYHLELPIGLVIVLNNYHYAPCITKCVISVSRLFDDGFINRFDDNNVISVSKNNLVYFMAVPQDGIFEIDMSCSNTNNSFMYGITNKRAKINLDSSLLWHCRLGHISKKRIEKLKHDGLLNSIDIESLGKCVSCMSGKMARKPYSHQVERAKDLLRLIHTDVCGPFKIVSRQRANYFVTFTNDFSRYSYVYLLKHKHEVFETFKLFQKEVENQLEKTIKSLRSDRGGKYMSQEFLDHLKEHGIIAHRTPPYTPQNNGVLERKNRTLLDMVRSMMSQTTLQKSFWDYALETAARILNMVPTNKRYTLSKPDKLDPRSFKCILVGYPKETMGYSFYNPSENKVIVAQNAEFFESKLLDLKASRSVEDLELIQKEDTNPSEHELGDLGEPANYKAALQDPGSKKWLDAINVEMQSMKDNDTDMDGAVYIFKARLVAKGFTQTYGVDYEETFSSVADIRAIRILIAIAAYYDYEIWQMDVKTDFLNGHLSEEVYTKQPEGFVNPKYPNHDKLKLKELMELSKKLSDRVLDLENIKIAQAKEIANLKKKVKKLERKRRSRTPGMNLFKIGTSRRRSLSVKDASKQGMNLKQRSIFEESDFDVQAMMDADYELVARLRAEEQRRKPLTKAQKRNKI